LTAAGYLEGGVTNTSYGTSYAYDKHGNMTNLIRNGRTGTSTFGTIDNLSMSYTGNQLIKADDAGTSVTLSASMDFKNNSTVAKEYFYDLNGNLTKDLNKGITGITYNFLNLPQSVAISNTLGQATNTYMYAADGRKLQAVIGTKQTDYVGNVIYENGALKRILVDGGYIEGGAYYFYLTDHLGNNRVVANASGGIVQTNHYYPFGMPFAEGVTTSQQPYKYNGKELDTERGLNLYDYGARFYDPSLGRWHSMDPSCEQRLSLSPYNFCSNNPIIRIDSHGALDDIVITGENNSSVTLETNLIDVEVNASSLGIDFGGNYSLAGEEVLGAALDIVGIVDPTGVADGLNAGLQAQNGEWGGALISAVGLVPYVGDLAKVGKAGKDIKIIESAINEVKSAKQLLKEGRAGKQERLLELSKDTKTSSADRGWIKQEKNAVDTGKRVNMRNPPGKDLAHSRGKEAAKGYSYKHSKLQDKDLHKRQHKYDNNGRKNKENPN